MVFHNGWNWYLEKVVRSYMTIFAHNNKGIHRSKCEDLAQFPESNTVTTEGLCQEISTGWSDRMALTSGLVDEDLVSTSWVITSRQEFPRWQTLYRSNFPWRPLVRQRSPQVIMGQMESVTTKAPTLNKPLWIPGAWTVS